MSETISLRVDVTNPRFVPYYRRMSLRRSGLLLSAIAGFALPSAAPAVIVKPPPATLTVGSSRIVLALGSYCWGRKGGATCADMIPPAQRRDIPTVAVARGAQVRVHLAFAAKQWQVQRIGAIVALKLAPGREATVIAHANGIITVDVLKSAQGSASYLFRFRVH